MITTAFSSVAHRRNLKQDRNAEQEAAHHNRRRASRQRSRGLRSYEDSSTSISKASSIPAHRRKSAQRVKTCSSRQNSTATSLYGYLLASEGGFEFCNG